MSGHKLLVVEDDFLIRLTLVEALQDEGFEVIEAASTDEASALLGSGSRIDMLITDIQLPGSMDGCALAAAARNHRPELPVIYMSGRPDTACALDPAREAMIAKPYLPSEVCGTVHRLLDR